MTVSIDWTDVAVHAVIGTGVGVVAAVIPWGGVMLVCANAIVWHGREALQRRTKGQPYSYTWTNTQVQLEWLGPSLTCLLAWLGISAIT